MRKRWMVGLVVVLLAILGCRAVTLAQKSKPIAPVFAGPRDPQPEPKRWTGRAKVAVQEDVPPPGPTDPLAVPGEARAADPSANDDPMAAVDTFLDRNRKEAEESIKALSREAEALKARLQKVEAALARWQGVSNALNTNQIQPAVAPNQDPGPQIHPIPSPEPTRPPPLVETVPPPLLLPERTTGPVPKDDSVLPPPVIEPAPPTIPLPK
jgi:hypothetical protein